MKGGALKGSARKKTTSLDGVLSNMRRHKIIEDNMEEPEKKEASWDAFIDIFSLPSTWLSKNIGSTCSIFLTMQLNVIHSLSLKVL